MTTPILVLSLAILQGTPSAWQLGPPLPIATANNAVAAVVTPDGPAVFSFLGIDSTKRWDGIHSRAFRWTIGTSRWTEVRSVPGPGRLAATAEGWRGRVFLFGGYTVQADGSEKSVPNVDVYHPASDTWTRGTDIPLPVDDAISGVWRDSLIFLVSGWHDRGNVSDVQIYDPSADRWSVATPIPGTPVFGHAGALAGNTIVYVDGAGVTAARPRFALDRASWRGDIDPEDPTLIAWTRLPDHPGPALYRAAGGVALHWVLFAGGTDNPYNYNGVGYDGIRAAPRAGVFGYDLNEERWQVLPSLPHGSMDHRGIVAIDEWLIIVAGMGEDQTVSNRVLVARTANALTVR